MKILITGAGFLGANLSENFYKTNHDVLLIGNSLPSEKIANNMIAMELPNPEFYSILQSFCPEIIIHTIGGATVSDSFLEPVKDFKKNTLSLIDVLDSVRISGLSSKLIYFSSAAVYGEINSIPIAESRPLQPISPYGYHKKLGELVCEEYSKIFGISCVIVRPFSIYGKGLKKQLFWDIFNKYNLFENIELLGNGSESRDFLEIKDLIQAIQLIIEYADFNGQAFNIASGKEVTIKEVASIYQTAIQSDKRINFSNKKHIGYPERWCADISKIKRLGFSQNVTLESGILNYIRWCQNETFRAN